MTFAESLDGLEAQIEGQCAAIMKDYWKSKKPPSGERRTTPLRSYFQPFDRTTCPGAGLIPFKLQRWYFACLTTLFDKRHGDGHPRAITLMPHEPGSMPEGESSALGDC